VTTGLQAARGDIICLLSHDCYAAPDWVENVVHAFESDPQVGIVQGLILPARPIDIPFYHCTAVLKPSRSFEGAAIAYRATAVDKAGRYYDRKFSRYGDDADMAWRIIEQGYITIWLELPTAYHEVVPLAHPFRAAILTPLGITVFPRLVKLHPQMRRQLRLGFLWGSRYRYLKMAGLHLGLIGLMAGQFAFAITMLVLAVGVAWYESLTVNRSRPFTMWQKLVLIPAYQMLSELIGSYALILGSLRWCSLVL